MDYTFKFDKDNKNFLLVYKDERIWTMIACPSIENGCDIINFDSKICKGYTYNYDGLILITTNGNRKLYHKGILLTETK